jgi:hypothetical protein
MRAWVSAVEARGDRGVGRRRAAEEGAEIGAGAAARVVGREEELALAAHLLDAGDEAATPRCAEGHPRVGVGVDVVPDLGAAGVEDDEIHVGARRAEGGQRVAIAPTHIELDRGDAVRRKDVAGHGADRLVAGSAQGHVVLIEHLPRGSVRHRGAAAHRHPALTAAAAAHVTTDRTTSPAAGPLKGEGAQDEGEKEVMRTHGETP